MTKKNTITAGDLILEGLNERQQEAVRTTIGPLLILAGAGSGKTRTLIHRIAYLIAEEGTKPWNILAVTFTNKAAQSMKERMTNLLGDDLEHMPMMGTFHSICARLLRKEIEALGYNTNFAIFDSADQLTLVKKIMKSQGFDTKQISPNNVHWKISTAKNQLLQPNAYAEITDDALSEVAADVYPAYQDELKKNNALDFDDLIMKAVELLDTYPEILKKYQKLWKYILVDEYQDTNPAQYKLVTLLADDHNNLCVVGDDAQCVTPSTKIKTKQGWKKAKDIKRGEKIISAGGRGGTLITTVERIGRKRINTEIIEIKTSSGKILQVTAEHMMFARLSNSSTNHYVYLMYRAAFGYRIGMAKGSRTPKKDVKKHGLQIRGNQEKADKMWVLRSCTTQQEAQYWEMLLSFEYGIPTTVFQAAPLTSIGQTEVNNIYKNINTNERIKRLCKDELIFLEYPHYRPSGTTRMNTERKIMRVDWFGNEHLSHSSTWHGTRIALHTTNTQIQKRLESHGFKTRKSKKNTWRMEISRKSISEAETVAAELKKVIPGIEQQRAAWMTANKKMLMMPAAHMKKEMIIPVLKGEEIVEEKIVSVERKIYKGEVIDFNVSNVHNFCAEGIMVHNSIYSWRQADIRNILEFEKDYPDAATIILEQNYRSTQTILDASNAVIAKNKKQKKKKLWTDNPAGNAIIVKEVPNEEAEGNYIVKEIFGLNEEKISEDTNSERYVDEDVQPDQDNDSPIQEGESILDRIMGASMFAGKKNDDDVRKQIEGKKKNTDFSRFVVLYRTNAQSRALEESFLRFNIPYKLIGGMRFYERREIKDVLAYIRALYNPDDWVSLERIVNAPPRGIGDRTWFKIEQFANVHNLNVLEAAERPIPDIQQSRQEAFSRFADIFKLIWTKIDALNPTQILELLLKEVDFKEYLLTSSETKEQGETRWENVQELKTVTQKFQHLRGADGLQALLEDIALVTDQDSVDETENAVKLMTVHAAKGLEFPVVFVVGMEEGLFPHSRSLIDPTEMEEERRLCYVALTRAIEQVYLVFASQRMRYGDMQVNPPSRFIDEIPSEFVEWK